MSLPGIQAFMLGMDKTLKKPVVKGTISSENEEGLYARPSDAVQK